MFTKHFINNYWSWADNPHFQTAKKDYLLLPGVSLDQWGGGEMVQVNGLKATYKFKSSEKARMIANCKAGIPQQWASNPLLLLTNMTKAKFIATLNSNTLMHNQRSINTAYKGLTLAILCKLATCFQQEALINASV